MRRDFHKSAIAQLNLLRTIGIAQMEKELVKNFKLAEKSSTDLEITQDYSEENVNCTRSFAGTEAKGLWKKKALKLRSS